MAIKRLILHIGRHKSGTSSLQYFFVRNQGDLSQQGVLYPDAGRAGKIAHHGLAHVCNTNLSDGQGLRQCLDDIRSEIRPHHHTLLISSEAFQNITDPERVQSLLDHFPNTQVEIYAYVREFVDYRISDFKQRIQAQSKFVTLDEVVGVHIDLLHFLKLWRGLGDLTLKWFERHQLKNNDIITDFCAETGLSGSTSVDVDINPSLGGNLLFLKLACNHLGIDALSYTQLRQWALKDERFRQGFYISRKRADAWRNGSDYNRILFKEMGEIPLRSWEDLPPLPDINSLPADLDLLADHLAPESIDPVLALGPKSRHWF